jgi:epoxide hydrolase-like predicted phosphatase
MIKTIIFDIGGVIVTSYTNELLTYVSEKTGLEKEDILRLIEENESDLESGKINHVDFWKLIFKDKNLNLSDEILAKLFTEPYERTVKKGYPEMIELVKKLKKNYIVGCVSNSIEPHSNYNRERGLYDLFDPCILSNEVGIAKPDKKIFLIYLEKAGCEAEEAIFIDDAQKNCAGAADAGIFPIFFENREQLEKDLIAKGVKIE